MSLKEKYQKEIIPKLQKELGIRNPMAVPRLSKIVINVGAKEALSDKKVLDKIGSQIALICGQKPVVRVAKKAIAGFKLRKGDPIGMMVTLRGRKMYDFFEKLVSIALPRVRDFRGVKETSFDQEGNFSLGFSEQIVFPEIDFDVIDKTRGLEVTIVTTAKKNEEGKKLLQALGMPFRKG